MTTHNLTLCMRLDVDYDGEESPETLAYHIAKALVGAHFSTSNKNDTEILDSNNTKIGINVAMVEWCEGVKKLRDGKALTAWVR